MMKMEQDPWSVLTECHSAQEQRNYTGSFCGFVLLNQPAYDLNGLTRRLKERWNLAPEVAVSETYTVEGGQEGDWLDEFLSSETIDMLTEPELGGDYLMFDVDGAMITVGFVAEPVPEGEAERFAANNQAWPEAAAVAATHQAHLMVAVLPRNMTAIEAGKTYVKVLSSCLEAPEAIGVYTSGTVLEPARYQAVTAAMEQGTLPLDNWVQIGFYDTENGTNAYTIGMDAFGKDEFEIMASQKSQAEQRALLVEIITQVLQEDLVLKSGDTFSYQGQDITMKRIDSKAVEGHSMVLDF